MSKCNTCGKFLAATGVAIVACKKCNNKYHKACLAFDAAAPIPKDWACPCCVGKMPRKENINSPLKSESSEAPKAISAQTNEDKSGPLSSRDGERRRQASSSRQACDKQTATTKQAGDHQQAASASLADERQAAVSLITTCTENTVEELILEMRMFREELRKNRKEMASFRKEIHVLKDDILYCKTKVDSVAQELISINDRIQELERNKAETFELRTTIDQLKRDLNDKDQDLLINDIEIMNIPESNNENLYHMLSVLATKLGTACAETDIVETFRAGPRRLVVSGESPAHPRPVVVRVTRRAVKDRLLQAARVRRNVTTADLSLPGTATKVYLNERLTKENRRLFKKAKEEGKRLSWRFVWTKYGKIYARKKDGSRLHSLRSDDDIERVFHIEEPTTEPSVQVESLDGVSEHTGDGDTESVLDVNEQNIQL